MGICILVQNKGGVFMYNSQIVAERIKKAVKENNTTMDTLNTECNLSKNAISSASKSSEGMKAKNLYMIAEFLGVSVDYLLGRTDTPTGYSDIKNSFTVGNGSTQTIGDHNIISTNQDINEDEREVIEILRSLPSRERTKLLSQIYDWDEKYKKKEV